MENECDMDNCKNPVCKCAQKYYLEVDREMSEDYKDEATSTAMSCFSLALAGLLFLVLALIAIFS